MLIISLVVVINFLTIEAHSEKYYLRENVDFGVKINENYEICRGNDSTSGETGKVGLETITL